MRAPRPPLQLSAVALEPRATVKLQPDVDIDLGQQRNLICAQPNAAPAALVKKAWAPPLVAVCKNPLEIGYASPLIRAFSCKLMADTGPIEGQYMPHAPPIVGRYGKRPHSRMRRLQLRTVHDLSVHHARLPLAPPQKNPLDKLSGCTMRAPPITLCSTLRSLLTA